MHYIPRLRPARCFPIFFVCVRHHLFSLDDQQLSVFSVCVSSSRLFFLFKLGQQPCPIDLSLDILDRCCIDGLYSRIHNRCIHRAYLRHYSVRFPFFLFISSYGKNSGIFRGDYFSRSQNKLLVSGEISIELNFFNRVIFHRYKFMNDIGPNRRFTHPILSSALKLATIIPPW